jgi:hypothetical protein
MQPITFLRDIIYRTTELNVPAVVKPQSHVTADTSSLTPCGELILACDIVRGEIHMLQAMSQ